MNDTALRRWLVACLTALLTIGANMASAQFALQGLLGEQVGGFAPVTAPRDFEFPRDHGAHPRFRSEWWYATGLLKTAAGRRFGVQLTLFRYGVSPKASRGEVDSAWRADSVWMGHMAVSDVRAEVFHSAEVFARGARVGAAGATVSPTRVWLGNWSFAHDDDAGWRLQAHDDGLSLQLEVTASKPLVLQGQAGYSRKSAAPGAASYYYAYTRLRGTGQVQVDGESFDGAVQLWLDREWSSGALAADQSGWDWFGLHLDDGRDLMLYRLRKADGRVDPFSAGAVVEADGRRTGLGANEFELVPGSPTAVRSGREYPLEWRLKVPAHGLDLSVRAAFAEQEHTGAVAYWEGLVEVMDAGGKTLGQGYLEMTGY